MPPNDLKGVDRKDRCNLAVGNDHKVVVRKVVARKVVHRGNGSPAADNNLRGRRVPHREINPNDRGNPPLRRGINRRDQRNLLPHRRLLNHRDLRRSLPR